MIGPRPHPLLRLVDRLIVFLAAINRPVASFGRDLSGLLVAAMVALALAQILSRALFDFTLDWAEELARFALVWTVLLVAPYAYREGANVAIGSFAAALPARLLLLISAALNVLAVWICAELFEESLAFWSRGRTLTASALAMQMYWVYAIVPLAFACLMLVGVELILRLLRSLACPDPDLLLAGAVPAVKAPER